MTREFGDRESMSSHEEIKSPEALRFIELKKDAVGRSLEGDYTWAETAEDEHAIHRKSMRGAYWESGDQEKMAMFELQTAKFLLGKLATSLEILANWDAQQKEKSFLERARASVKGWKEGWEKIIDKSTAELGPVLSALGISVPRTAEETRTLKMNIMSSENLQKLAPLINKTFSLGKEEK